MKYDFTFVRMRSGSQRGGAKRPNKGTGFIKFKHLTNQKRQKWFLQNENRIAYLQNVASSSLSFVPDLSKCMVFQSGVTILPLFLFNFERP